jgi:phage terminase large subunit-like protein
MAARRKLAAVPSRADRVLDFVKRFILVPEGKLVGKPLKLDKFQVDFIRAIYDNPHTTRRAVLSIARKNGKSALIAALVLAHLIGPERKQNSQIASGALSRDQAALVFKLALKMLQMQPAFDGLYKSVPSSKILHGLRENTEFRALSADGGSNMGGSPILLIIDEAGQVVGATSPFLEAVLTSQGAHEHPLTVIISTQAPSDADFLSLIIDDAKRSGDPHTVCHVYEADKDCPLLDKKQWKKANPSTFRNMGDLEEQLKQASRLPPLEAAARNLLLNQRVSINSLWLAPGVWKENSAPYNDDVFQEFGAHIGLDLSKRNDLTAAAFAAKDAAGQIHLKVYAFTPAQGLAERTARDRAPYDAWVRSGDLIAVPGATIDYEWVAEFLRIETESKGITVHSVQFDRWRISEFRSAADRVGFAPWSWQEVGQGYKDISPRLESFETALLQKRIQHGSQPVLNLGASSAIVVADPAGNKKLDKLKASQKIDAMVAAVMAAHPLIAQTETEFSAGCFIG